MHLNVQSLTNKLDIIQAEFGGFDIITLNETWLDCRSTSDDFLIQGFKEPFRRDRTNNRYGGVIIYVNSNIPCRRRYDIEVDQVECIWVECVIHKKKYLIGTFYRPPNSDNDVWDLIAYSMEKSKDTNIENILITGDFNENLNSTQNPKIIDIISDLGMTQIRSNTFYRKFPNFVRFDNR